MDGFGWDGMRLGKKTLRNILELLFSKYDLSVFNSCIIYSKVIAFVIFSRPVSLSYTSIYEKLCARSYDRARPMPGNSMKCNQFELELMAFLLPENDRCSEIY